MDSQHISHEPHVRDMPPLGLVPDEAVSPDRFDISFRGVFHAPDGSRDLFLRRLADCIGCGLPPPAMPSGRFAISIRDRMTGVLYLVTDWLGSEPVYYTRIGKFWRWSFDLTRLAVLLSPRQLDERAMDEYFTYRWINE